MPSLAPAHECYAGLQAHPALTGTFGSARFCLVGVYLTRSWS
jgi:hypothetical protein